MRLGQLARKLDKKPLELLDFLEEEHQIIIESDLNTKVEGEALNIVMEAFKKEEPVEIVAEVVAEKVVVEDIIPEALNELAEEAEPNEDLSEEEIEDIAAEAVVKEIDKEELESQEEAIFEDDNTIEERNGEITVEKIARIGEDGEELPELIVEGGVIKAPKPELDGPTVVGKIELPTIKRSVQFLVTNGDHTQDVTEEIYEKRKTDKENRKKKAIEARKERQSNQQKKRKRKVITDADRKAFEEKRRQRKNAELKEKQAEKRKRHYKENVQQKTAVHSKKKKQKEIEKAVKKQKATTPKLPEPTTLWGKFKRWLNT